MRSMTRGMGRPLEAVVIVVLAACLALPAPGGGARAATPGMAPAFGAGDWPVFMRDAQKTGANAAETLLTPATVGGLHRLWLRTLDGTPDSTPIRLAGVALPDGSHRDLLFVTASDGVTYALDSRTGTIVWRHAAAWGPRYTTSSPVADPSRRWIYAPGVDGKVHKLAAATGREDTSGGWPVTITLMPDIEKHSSALNLANGYLYAATGGYPGDQGTYTGHVVAIRLSDAHATVFNTLCAGVRHLLLDRSRAPASRYACSHYQSGVWARAGTVVEPSGSPLAGRVYATTGNGDFDASSGGAEYGDSVLALSADLGHLIDYWTPRNQQDLQSSDTDIGSTTPILLPRQPASTTPWLAVQGGKDGVLRLLDRQHLGHLGGELSTLPVPGGAILTAGAVWQDPRTPAASPWIVVTNDGGITALRVVTGANGVSRLRVAWTIGTGATSPVIAGGMIFAATSGDLVALDLPSGKKLWSSQGAGSGGSIGTIHWQSPIVVGGVVYIADQDHHVAAYGLR